MFGPYDGEVVGDRSDPIEFWGAYPVDGETIQIDARFPADGQYYYVDSTQTDSSSQLLFGTDWFLWAKTVVLPLWAWRAGVTGYRAQVRSHGNAGDLASFPIEGLNCVVQADSQGLSPTTAQAQCASPSTPGAFVYTQDYQGLPSLLATPDHPHEVEYPGTDENQGVASTATHWVFTNNVGEPLAQGPTLVKIPLDADLGQGATWTGALTQDMPGTLQTLGYDHYGDPDVHDGHIYVPVEGPGLPGAFAQFDLDLQFEGYGTIADPTAAWVAIDPVSGSLFTSAFHDVSQVDVYAMVHAVDGTLVDLTFVQHRTLRGSHGGPYVIQRVQGGAFSAQGNLYLASDADHDGVLPPSGVYGFEGDSLRFETYSAIENDPGAYHEVEGIEVRDLAGAMAPSIDGQIHVVLLDNDWPNSDDLIFKHFEVAAPGQLPFL